GRLWLVVVDGRQAPHSLGMTLPELTELLEALGAEEALNLDGGGSSVMVVRGAVHNRPSDEAGERAVVNALALVRDPAACKLR
ncbi:MAG: phosphodiester glycosidase family protein, partial [Gemmatimonadetes bacterium]|nr:phosphodiester glycosidase family protein [Gemmatimonadota bacterium]